MEKKLTPGEIVIAASGIVLFIISFLKWYGVNFNFFGKSLGSVGLSGWQAPSSFLSVVAILIGLAMAVFVLVTRLAGVKVPEKVGSIGWGVILLGGGGVAALFLILKWVFNTSYTKVPFYIAILAGIGLAVGGFMTANERGDLAALKGQKGGSAPPA